MAHPHAAHRQSKVERSRVGHITRGYASGGAVGTGETAKEKSIAKKVFKVRDAQAVEGGSVKERMDRPGRKAGGRVQKRADGGEVRPISVSGGGNKRYVQKDGKWFEHDNFGPVGPMPAGWSPPGRARGGRAPKKAATNVNVIVAPSGGHNATPPSLPMAGVAAPGAVPPPMPPRPLSPGMPGMAGPPGAALPPPGMAPPGMPPRSSGGRTYKTGGRVKSDAGVASGRAWEEGKRNGTQMQNNPSGKNDQGDVNRPRPITYKTGGAIYSASKGQMGPKFDGGAGGGTARKEKETRAAKNYAKAH